MRTFIAVVLALAALVAAVALYLYFTTPSDSTPLRLPIPADQRELLGRVPAAADGFALIPSAARLHAELLANPVTRDAVQRWSDEQPLPSPWVIGGADVAAWRVGERTSYAIRLDMVRAFLVRIWMMSSSSVTARWDGSVFVINGTPAPRIEASDLDRLLDLASGLPEGDVFVVQRNRVRGVFPPIGRPAVSSVRVTAAEIVVTSRAETDAEPSSTFRARYPRGAILAAAFASAPAILGDFQRLVGTNLRALLDDGGALALYDVDAGTLLPRPKGVIVLPANAESRAAIEDIGPVAALVGETRDTGSELLLSFDRSSVGQYLKDGFVEAAWPANRWSMRIDAPRIVPILERLGDNRGMRIATPRLHRAARDLRRWISALREAESIEAAASISGGIEELRVRIASK